MATVELARARNPAKKGIKIVPQLDTYPWLVKFGQTPSGKAVLLGAFAFGLVLIHVELWIELTAVVAATTFFPARRRMLLSVATLGWLLFNNSWFNWPFLRSIAQAGGQRADWPLTALVAAVCAAWFCLIALFFRYVRSQPNSFLAKRPVLCLIACDFLMLAAAGMLPLAGMARLMLWTVVAVSLSFLWYFAYALKDASSKTPDGILLQFGTMRPFWGPSNMPYAKGAANLRKVEARTPEDLCISQLKAIKLLIWVFILRFPLRALMVIVYGIPTDSGPLVSLAHRLHFNLPNLGIPELATALQQPSVPVFIAWASVFAHFAEALLMMTIFGNIIIACARMAGFNLLRNTYRPLESRTVAEFWNRYYYYFKELLVEFFFFPTFTRYFKQHRRIRVFAATIAAATVGNMIYHFLQYYSFVAEMGPWRDLAGFQTYTFYAIVLGLGIGISQLRGQGKVRMAHDAPWWRKTLATTGVVVFFCLLDIFDQDGRSVALGQCLRFFLHLFFIPA